MLMDQNDFSEEMTYTQTPAMDTNLITEHILKLVLEIVRLLIGEEYIITKKPGASATVRTCSSASEDLPRTRSLIKAPPDSRNYGRKNEKKILEVTQKIIHLLTREVPLRSEDIAVYFSLEEWEYLEENKDLYKNVMLENHLSLRLLDGSKSRSLKERYQQHNPLSDGSHQEETVDKTISNGKCFKLHESSTEHVEPECEKVYLAHTTNAKPTEYIETSVGSTSGSDLSNEVNFINTDMFSLDEQPATYINKESDSGSKVNVPKVNADVSPECAPLVRIKEEPFSDEERTNPHDHFLSMYVKEEPDINKTSVTTQTKSELLSWEYGDITPAGLSTTSEPAEMGSIDHTNNIFAPDEGKVFFNNRLVPNHMEQKPASQEENHNANFYTSSDHTLILGNLYAEVEKYAKGNLSVIKCNECGRSFNSKSAYTFHQRASSKGRMYNCSEYQKYFISNSDLIKQPSVNKDKNFSCSECGKCFSWMAQLLKHQWDHIKEKRFTCSECGKRCSCETDLLNHQKVHVKEIYFACTECGKQFTQKEHLAIHQKTHEVENREKRFACSECGLSYTKRSHLVRHQKAKHEGAKPCICSECGKSFTDDVYLSKHQMAHTGEKPFWCSDCGKCFTRGSYLIKHQRTHTK